MSPVTHGGIHKADPEEIVFSKAVRQSHLDVCLSLGIVILKTGLPPTSFSGK
jgi:hypothetical protein